MCVVAGPKEGVHSAAQGTYTHKLKCASAHCFGCTKYVKIVEHIGVGVKHTIDVFDAKGWLHCHSGPFVAKRGLPPQLTKDLETAVTRTPTLTPRQLVVEMVERIGWSMDFKQRIVTWLNNNKKNRPAMSLGYAAPTHPAPSATVTAAHMCVS